MLSLALAVTATVAIVLFAVTLDAAITSRRPRRYPVLAALLALAALALFVVNGLL